MSFLVWVYTSQDFAQSQLNFARSHDRVTVTFRNSAATIPISFNFSLQFLDRTQIDTKVEYNQALQCSAAEEKRKNTIFLFTV